METATKVYVELWRNTMTGHEVKEVGYVTPEEAKELEAKEMVNGYHWVANPPERVEAP